MNLTTMFPTALRRETYTQDSDEYESYLALIYMEPSGQHDGDYHYVMGDLRGLMDVPEGFEENEDGRFGNYIPEARLQDLLAMLVSPQIDVKLESEGGTFFAYGDEENLNLLMDFIRDNRDDFRD